MNDAKLKVLDTQHTSTMTPTEAAAWWHLSEVTFPYSRRVNYLYILANLDETQSGNSTTRYVEAKEVVSILQNTTDEDIALIRPHLESLQGEVEGLNLGNATVRLMLDSKTEPAPGAIFTATQTVALKALAEKVGTPEERDGLGRVRTADIERVRVQ